MMLQYKLEPLRASWPEDIYLDSDGGLHGGWIRNQLRCTSNLNPIDISRPILLNLEPLNNESIHVECYYKGLVV